MISPKTLQGIPTRSFEIESARPPKPAPGHPLNCGKIACIVGTAIGSPSPALKPRYGVAHEPPQLWPRHLASPALGSEKTSGARSRSAMFYSSFRGQQRLRVSPAADRLASINLVCEPRGAIDS